MILADTNLFANLTMKTPLTPVAERIWNIDREWLAPPLCRSEFLNVLWQSLRNGVVGPTEYRVVLELFGEAIRETTPPDPLTVLEVAMRARHPTYDCEFVVAARQLGIRVVTFDKLLHERFPADSILAESFTTA